MGYDKHYRKTVGRGSGDFRGGVYSHGVPVMPAGVPLTMGTVYHVDSGHAAASNNNSGTNPDQPLATIDAAVGKCTASAGDIIMVAPGHAETISAAAGIDADIAGISIIGMGQGALRPTITFGTANAADIDIDAANIRIENFVFLCDKDGLTAPLDVNAADFTLVNCEFREGSAKQWVTAVDINGGAANACDRAHIYGCVFKSITAGATQAIELGEVADSVRIEGNWIYGDWTSAGIHNPAAKVLTNLLIADNVVANLNTGNHAIELVSACTGLLTDNRMYGDTLGTILDPGSLYCLGNLETDAIDQAGVDSPRTSAGGFADASITAAVIATGAIDADALAADTILGADNNNNAFASTNVASNADGSLIEREEWIQAQVGTLANTGGTATLGGILGDVSNVTVATNLAKIGTVVNTGGTATLGGALGDVANVTVASSLAKLGTIVNTGGTATVGGVLGDVANVSMATSLAQIGTVVNTGGTATLGGVLGDLANDSLVARLNDVGTDVNGATTDTIQGKLGTDTELADRSMFDLLAGDGPASYPAAAAPANDVSIAEVARAIYDRQLGDGTNASTNSLLGKRVLRTAADIFDGTLKAMYTVSGGRILLTHFEIEVTVANIDAGASAAKIVANPTIGADLDLCATLDINADLLGSVYTLAGVLATALQGGVPGGAPGMSVRGIVIPEGTIDLNTAADVGAVGGALGKCELWYIPLDDGASVAAA